MLEESSDELEDNDIYYDMDSLRQISDYMKKLEVELLWASHTRDFESERVYEHAISRLIHTQRDAFLGVGGLKVIQRVIEAAFEADIQTEQDFNRYMQYFSEEPNNNDFLNAEEIWHHLMSIPDLCIRVPNGIPFFRFIIEARQKVANLHFSIDSLDE